MAQKVVEDFLLLTYYLLTLAYVATPSHVVVTTPLVGFVWGVHYLRAAVPFIHHRYNNKTYRIDDIDFNKNPMTKFKTRNGEEISFVDYYKKVRSYFIVTSVTLRL